MDKPGDIDHAAALQAWRASGAERVDPVRFRFIEAMVRRAQALQGTARQLLDARVATLLADYGDAIARAQNAETAVIAPATAAQPGPLSALTQALAQHAAAQIDPDLPQALPPSLAGPPELKSAHYFRSTWSRLAAQKRLTQSLAQLPENAGPLNSHRLVHRAMSLMHDLSPEYLQKFMAHVEALMWLDRLQASATAPAKEAPKSKATSKVATKTASKTSRKPRAR